MNVKPQVKDISAGTHEEDCGDRLVDPTVLFEKMTNNDTTAKQADEKSERNEIFGVCHAVRGRGW